MIYQYLYGRAQTGYRQLNEIKDLQLSPSDKASLEERLNVYQIMNGMDQGNLPECFYYYNAAIAGKSMGIVGRTSYVPAASSQASGTRSTSFSHKYLFDGADYELLLDNPQVIFGFHDFCENVEQFDSGETDNIPMMPEDPHDRYNFSFLLDKLGLDQIDLPSLLYALIDSSYKKNCRVYIVLPNNTAETAGFAKNLVQAILRGLPKLIVANFGFLTYYGSFHEAQHNPIPIGIRLVFIARDSANVLRYEEIAGKDYLLDLQNNRDVQVPMSEDTRSLIKKLCEGIVQGNYDQELYGFFAMLEKKVDTSAEISPETLAAAYRFYQWYTKAQATNRVDNPPGEMLQVFETMLTHPSFIASGMEYDLNDFISRYLNSMGEISEKELPVFSCFFKLVPSKRKELVSFMCDRILAELSKAQSSKMIMVINYEFEADFSSYLYDFIYSTEKYQFVASAIVLYNLRRWKAVKDYTDLEKIEHIYSDAGKLYDSYPELVKSRSYINALEKVFYELLINKDRVDYSDIYGFYQVTCVFGREHGSVESYGNMATKLVIQALQKIPDMNQMEEDTKEQLRKWDIGLAEALKKKGYANADIMIQELLRLEYRKMLRSYPIQDKLVFLEHCPQKEINAYIKEFQRDLNGVISDYIHDSSKNDDAYRCFLQYTILSYQEVYDVLLAVERKEKLIGLAKLWEGIQYKITDEKHMQATINHMKPALRSLLIRSFEISPLRIKQDINNKPILMMMMDLNLTHYVTIIDDEEDAADNETAASKVGDEDKKGKSKKEIRKEIKQETKQEVKKELVKNPREHEGILKKRSKDDQEVFKKKSREQEDIWEKRLEENEVILKKKRDKEL